METADSTTGTMDAHVGKFYGTTTKVLGDLGELALQFDGHGKILAEAVNLLDKSNKETMAAVGDRKSLIEGLAAAVKNRTDELDERLKRFSTLLDDSLRAAEERARDVAEDGRRSDGGRRSQHCRAACDDPHDQRAAEQAYIRCAARAL